MEGVTVLCPIFLFFQIASCTVTPPSSQSLQHSVGDNATLKWTSTKNITQVRFGLYDSSTDNVSPQFVSVNPLAGVQFTNLTNTAKARYNGRVRYVGDLTLGYAWFKLLDLKRVDFNETYVARILEDGEVGETSYPVNLSLIVTTPSSSMPPVSFSPSSTTTPTTSSTRPTTSITTPPTKILKDWVIAVIVLSVIIVLVAAILIGCYCCCPQWLEDCWNRCCPCCPCKCLKDWWNRCCPCCPCKCLKDCWNCCCPCCPCKIKVEGSSEEPESEMKSKTPSAEK